jgi:hypothetical protein
MGLFDRFKRPAPAPAEAEPRADAADEVSDDDVREAVRERVLPGFLDKADVVEHVGEYLEIEGDPRVARIVDEVWTDRLQEEAGWSGAGDYAKLEAAFAALAEQGVVGRMDFTCCQTCGTAEIDDERTPADVPEGEYPFREWGYTFFHQQDTERLLDEPATLYLSYSTFVPSPDVDDDLIARWREDDSLRGEVVAASDASVGHRVADALRAQGLDVTWDGDTGQRVEVAITEWRKPLPR